jgi:putative tricarboxylic transport membrane protein
MVESHLPAGPASRLKTAPPALLCLLLACGAPGAAAQSAWKPSRAVEIVVGVGPGGGIDRTARTVQKILHERRLLEVPSTVVNRPGGGGTVAQAYLNQRAGDAHYWEITATSLLTNHITGRSASSHRDYTPLAMLYDEYIGFAVRADSPIRDGRALLEALRANPDALPVGIATAAGNTNHIAAGIAARSAGGDVKRLRVVVFGSGGESMTALLGGHVGLVVTPSANLIPHLQAGRLRVLAVAAPRRLEGALAAVPTWREQGVDAVVANWRPVIGPRGLSAPQVAFWEEVFARLTRTEEWRDEVDKAGGVNNYMNGRDLGAYLDAQYAQFKSILTELGLAKSP